jgi:DedD protein
MSFFGDDRGAAGGSARPPASGGPTAGAAGGPTTLREDLGAGAAESEPPPPEPEPEPEPARTPPPATAAAADRTAPPGPVPAPPAPARSAPAAAAEPPAAAGLVVQVFSSRDPDQARKIVDRLNRGGSPAYLSPVEVSGQTMYRVRVGPYTDRAEAQRVADQIRRDFKLDTWITQ